MITLSFFIHLCLVIFFFLFLGKCYPVIFMLLEGVPLSSCWPAFWSFSKRIRTSTILIVLISFNLYMLSFIQFFLLEFVRWLVVFYIAFVNFHYTLFTFFFITYSLKVQISSISNVRLVLCVGFWSWFCRVRQYRPHVI